MYFTGSLSYLGCNTVAHITSLVRDCLFFSLEKKLLMLIFLHTCNEQKPGACGNIREDACAKNNKVNLFLIKP